ncbi:unnamed protein product [Symbiodinium necroappetens]|uniref:Uncharacterized protein n=1 Tax=Symbiodinium necroappetens TaxID=1628268 RepID=A0A812JPU8_9DINO|nr:unnamed protein product [Symbiodinium necroappetens]
MDSAVLYADAFFLDGEQRHKAGHVPTTASAAGPNRANNGWGFVLRLGGAVFYDHGVVPPWFFRSKFESRQAFIYMLEIFAQVVVLAAFSTHLPGAVTAFIDNTGANVADAVSGDDFARAVDDLLYAVDGAAADLLACSTEWFGEPAPGGAVCAGAGRQEAFLVEREREEPIRPVPTPEAIAFALSHGFDTETAEMWLWRQSAESGNGGGESEEEPTDEEEPQRPEHGDVSSEVRGSPVSQQAWQAMELHMQAQEKKLCSASRALKRARSQVQQLTAQLSLKDIERARLETQVAQFRTLLVEKERRLHGALDALDAAGAPSVASGGVASRLQAKVLPWIESLVAARLRSAGRQPVAFVRVDAPLRQGGAGQSLLVESHRSILCPSWDPCTFVLEPTLTVEEFTSRKLPKWRELTTEEILSTKDRELLKLDRVETGPRYHVWTLSNAASFSALASARDWTGLWDPAEEEVPPDHLKEAEEGCMQREASALLLPLQSPERPLYVTAERGGLVTLWDLRHRCAWQSFRMSAEASPRRRSLVSGRGEGSLGLRVAALGPAGGSHFAVAGTLPSGALLFQLFEVRSVGPQRVQQLQLSPVELPWHQWPRWPWEDLQRSSVGVSMDPVEVRFVCAGSQGSTLVAIAAAEGRPEVALMLDLEGGSVKVIDLYRGGPPSRSNWTDEAFFPRLRPLQAPPAPPAPPVPPPEAAPQREAEAEPKTERDRLVMATSFEGQSFQEDRNQTSGLLCLWKSNRLCILSFSDWRVYDQMLLGDSASRQTRMDMPLCAALLPSDAGSGGCSLVVSYASMIIRWWQVSLHGKIQQACLVLHHPVTHLAAQSCENKSWAKGRARREAASPSTVTTGRSSSKAESRQSRGGSRGGSRGRSSEGQEGHASELGLTESSDRILVAAMDETRAVTLFLGHGATIERVYSVDATWGSSIVDGIWIMDTHFALLLRSGEVRHIEFDFNGELMQIGEIFAPDRT